MPLPCVAGRRRRRLWLPRFLRTCLPLLIAFATMHGVSALDLTPDLRCSACVVTADVVEAQIVALLENQKQLLSLPQGQRTTSPAAALPLAVRDACRAIPKAAIAGKPGKREFLDFNRAMRREQRGSKETGLVDVQFTRDVTDALRRFCDTTTAVSGW
jgi:hypothetical protein